MAAIGRKKEMNKKVFVAAIAMLFLAIGFAARAGPVVAGKEKEPEGQPMRKGRVQRSGGS
jgi:hypothetical protein